MWRDIPGSEKYQISIFGEVRKKLKNNKYRNIKIYIRKHKWMTVKVDFKGTYKEYNVHKLMAAAFRLEGKAGQVLHHKNGNIRDNHIDNLQWINQVELARKTGGKSNRVSVAKIDPGTGEVLEIYKSGAEAARKNYTHKENIYQAIRGTKNRTTAAGFKWAKGI